MRLHWNHMHLDAPQQHQIPAEWPHNDHDQPNAELAAAMIASGAYSPADEEPNVLADGGSAPEGFTHVEADPAALGDGPAMITPIADETEKPAVDPSKPVTRSATTGKAKENR